MSQVHMNNKIIVGNGWAALTALAFELASSESELIWILGSGTRLPAVLPTLPKGPAVEVLRTLMDICGSPVGTSTEEQGEFVSEFRNKSFRAPSWDKLSDELWGAERYLISPEETDSGISLDQAEQVLREKIAQQVGIRIRKIEECALREIELSTHSVRITLASGEMIEAGECIYADRWNDLRTIKGGLHRARMISSEKDVKLSELLRHSDPTSTIQVTFNHKSSIDVEAQHGFFAVTHRESGENFDRRVWGYFLDGKTSRWSLGLTQEEAEDNHLIAKKIRRIKQSLNRIAADVRWVPEGAKEFSDTIESEHVSLQEGVLFSSGEIIHGPLHTGKHFKLVGDGFGIGPALEQAGGLYLHSSEAALHQQDASI